MKSRTRSTALAEAGYHNIPQGRDFEVTFCLYSLFRPNRQAGRPVFRSRSWSEAKEAADDAGQSGLSTLTVNTALHERWPLAQAPLQPAYLNASDRKRKLLLSLWRRVAILYLMVRSTDARMVAVSL